MDLSVDITCPNCSSINLEIKRKVTYVYTYKLNTEENKERIDKNEPLPFLFDNREKYGSDEYILCEKCGAKYPISLGNRENRIDFTILRKAIRSDHTENP
ncbi:MAG: hypothetical protein Q8930_01040, partial [Bacillota bacterium]|nr:hypothetical protein [Bacillota bacterium]